MSATPSDTAWSDKPRVVPAGGTGTYRHAATFGDLKRMSGNLVNSGATVSNLNTIFLEDLPVEQTEPALTQVRRYRAAFNPASDAVRFYACDVLASNDTSQNCVALGEGSSTIARNPTHACCASLPATRPP